MYTGVHRCTQVYTGVHRPQVQEGREKNKREGKTESERVRREGELHCHFIYYIRAPVASFHVYSKDAHEQTHAHTFAHMYTPIIHTNKHIHTQTRSKHTHAHTPQWFTHTGQGR